MSFAVVTGTNTSTSTTTTSHVVSLPASITAGDLLFVGLLCDAGSTVDTPTGWTKESDVANATRRIVFYTKVAVGGDALTVTSSGATSSAHFSYKIVTNNVGVTVSTVSSTDTFPDPPNLTPGTTEKFLWIAVAGSDGFPTSYPTNYTSNQVSVDSGSFGIASSTRQLEASSEDPPNYTYPGSVNWIASTIAISEQTPITVSFPLITITSSIIQPTVDFAANCTFNLISKISNVFTPTASVDTKTGWVNEEEPTETNWSNEI